MIERITCTKILQTINSYKKHTNADFLVIFDLDDTILDTFSRRFFIYKDYLKNQFHLPKISFNLQKNHYNFISIIENDINYKELNSEIRNFYLKLFFSEQFLYLDIPFLGVMSFFKRLSDFAIPLIFLTGRPESTMKKATCEILNRYKLYTSINDEENLFMKKNPAMPDHLFKKIELKHILNLFPEEKIIIFDNESQNCKVFNQILSNDAMIVRFNSIEQRTCNFDGFLMDNWIY